MSTDLRQFADELLECAQAEHTAQGQAGTVVFILCRDDRRALIPIHSKLTSAYTSPIIATLRRYDGIAIFLAGEFWLKFSDLPKDFEKLSVLDRPEPRNSPDKVEAFGVIAVHENGTQFSKYLVFQRTPFGPRFSETVDGVRSLRDGTTDWFKSMLAAK